MQALLEGFFRFLMSLSPYVTPLYVNRAGMVSGGFRVMGLLILWASIHIHEVSIARDSKNF